MNDTKKSRDGLTRQDLAKITTACYMKAISNLGLDEHEARYAMDRHSIDVEYCKEVRKLPTHQLEWILNGHLDEVLLREDFTVNNILEELTERSLLLDAYMEASQELGGYDE